jgi:molybdopterin converting factor small subunit
MEKFTNINNQMTKENQLRASLSEKEDRDIIEALKNSNNIERTPYQNKVLEEVKGYINGAFQKERYPVGGDKWIARVKRFREIYIALELSRITKDDYILEKVVNQQANDKAFNSKSYKDRMKDLCKSVYENTISLTDSQSTHSQKQLMDIMQNIVTENENLHEVNTKLRSTLTNVQRTIGELESKVEQMKAELTNLKNSHKNNINANNNNSTDDKNMRNYFPRNNN